MKIKFLGTAAYEGIPTIFCQCKICNYARQHGGKDMRSRSQALIDDILLVDFPADTLWHTHRFGLDFTKIKNCIITHSHSDHFYPEDMEMLRRDFCHGYDLPFNFYSGETAHKKMKGLTKNDWMKGSLTTTLLKDNVPVLIDGYTVTPYVANHSPATSPFVYRIQKGEKSLLYGNDSGILSEESWNNLVKGGRLDLVSLDCTGGFQQNWRDGHLSIDTFIEAIQRMRDSGIVDDATVLVANHFSHNGLATYDELFSALQPYGIIVSYDGMEVEF